MKSKVLLVLSSVVLVVVIAGCGGSSSDEGGGEQKLEEEINKVTGQLERQETAREVVEDKAEAAREHLNEERIQVIAGAERQANQIVTKAKRKEDDLSGLESKISQRQGELQSVEDSLSGAREEKAKSTIPGSGTYRSEVDYIPGIYESNGGAYCYWATLNSADNFDIANNENAEGPTIAEITTPYFQTKGCGTWHKIE